MRFKHALTFMVLAFALASSADAGVLWYNGDSGSTPSGTINEESTNLGSFTLFDNFVVNSPGGWLVDTVWSYNMMSVTGITQATWSIRTGMSVGNGGTVVASGVGSATQTATGKIGVLSTPEYKIQVTGLNVFLNPGTYWLSVAPNVGQDSFGILKSYGVYSTGTNAVGTPPGNDLNSFFYAPSLGYNYANAFNHDYSMGVAGSVMSAAVPEPTSLALFGLGAIGVAAIHRRRRPE